MHRESPVSTAIKSIEVYAVAVPLVGSGFRNAYLTKTVQKSAVVRVTSADGTVGLGNIDPSPGYSVHTIDESLHALREKLVPRVLGLDAANIHRLYAAMDEAAPSLFDAKAAIEMACVDLTCRQLGIPVHAYLGGAVRDTLRFNAWIGILPAEEAANEAHAWFKRGFRSAKIKIGSGVALDRERVKAVRDAVGPQMQLRVDANAGYSVEDAIALGRALEPFSLQLFEQPVAAHDLAGMAKVRTAIGIPVMADESVLDHTSLVEIIRAGAADIVKLKVMKQGGLINTRRMLATAEVAGLRVVIGHGFGLGINTAAEIMLAATAHSVIEGLECVGPLKTVDDIITRRFDLSSGSVSLPAGPGLGVELSESKLEQYRFD